MSNHQQNLCLSKPILLSLLGSVLASALLLLGCRPSSDQPDRPKEPETAKREILLFLKEKSGRTDFATTIPAGLTNAVDTNPTTEETPTTSPRHITPQDLPKLAATEEFRKRTSHGEDWATIYGLFGEQLWIADQLLLSPDPAHRETGVIVAAEVARQGIRDGIDPWFSPRVVEAYLWPAFKSIENQGSGQLTVSALGNLTRFVFQRAHETNNIILNYRAVIENTTNFPTADRARIGLVRVYELQGNYQQALNTLHQIHSSNEFVGLRISNLVHKLQGPVTSDQ